VDPKKPDPAQTGLKRLCGLFERINNGEKAMDEFNNDGLLVRKNLVKVSLCNYWLWQKFL
jgi:hypothetical protein